MVRKLHRHSPRSVSSCSRTVPRAEQLRAVLSESAIIRCGLFFGVPASEPRPVWRGIIQNFRGPRVFAALSGARRAACLRRSFGSRRVFGFRRVACWSALFRPARMAAITQAVGSQQSNADADAAVAAAAGARATARGAAERVEAVRDFESSACRKHKLCGGDRSKTVSAADVCVFGEHLRTSGRRNATAFESREITRHEHTCCDMKEPFSWARGMPGSDDSIEMLELRQQLSWRHAA